MKEVRWGSGPEVALERYFLQGDNLVWEKVSDFPVTETSLAIYW